MDWNTTSFDWNQVRAFVLAAETGSFSAAARLTGASQPTLGRQVASLEEKLGVTLFERVGRQLQPTESGLALLDHARVMTEAANKLTLTAAGHAQNPAGRVCISATDLVIQHLLPGPLATLRQLYPGIDIDLLASDKLSDLQRREADIAIRHTRPDQPDLVAKLLHESDASFCAAPSFIAKHGMPTTRDALRQLDFIGFDQSGRMFDFLEQAGVKIDPGNVHMRSENGVVAWELVKQGFGIGLMARHIIQRTPEVEIVLPEFVPARIPYWLVTHREVHTSRKIRLVFDQLASGLMTQFSQPSNFPSS